MPRNRTRRRRLHQQSNENFCFQDWNNWDESIRWKIIDGQGIDQFWLLDPVQQMVWVNRLNERGGYQFPQFVNADAVLEMGTLGGVKIDWIAAFDMS